MDNNTLTHWGVKGMRWGVRRYQNPDGSLTPAGKDRQKKQEMRDAVKNRRSLSDADLDKRISRLKKEKELKKLTDEEINVGKSAVVGVLTAVGTTVATTFIAGAVKYGVKATMTKNFSWKEAADYITPKPKK